MFPSHDQGGELGFGYFALDYKSESLKFTTYTPEKVTDLEIEVLQYYNPLVRNNFKQFLNGLLEIQPTGYEFRINSVVRSFADAIRIYKGEGNNFTSLSSMHLWGTAIDISIYEAGAIDQEDGKGKKYLLYGKGEPFTQKWRDLGIEDLAYDEGLRWGGTFKDPKSKNIWDNVHFDARKIILDEGWTKSKARKAITKVFPSLEPYITDSFNFNNYKDIDKELRLALDSFTLEGNNWEIDKNDDDRDWETK